MICYALCIGLPSSSSLTIKGHNFCPWITLQLGVNESFLPAKLPGVSLRIDRHTGWSAVIGPRRGGNRTWHRRSTPSFSETWARSRVRFAGNESFLPAKIARGVSLSELIVKHAERQSSALGEAAIGLDIYTELICMEAGGCLYNNGYKFCLRAKLFRGLFS